MSALELLEGHPQVAKLICEYYLQIMIDSLNDDNLPEDFKTFVREQGIDNDKITEMIEKNPRNLFDFFDEYKIFVNITAYSSGLFGYSILGTLATLGTSTTFPSRKEAEKQAIEIAIGELEKSLTKSVISKENS